ncbi:MAG: hypothetical protein WC606_03575 [Candidatus Absconditabacterales bacterium]|jgi:hypothetical protein
MKLHEAKLLKDGDTVFCCYEKGVIEGEIRENTFVSVNAGSVSMNTTIGLIFLPTKHVKKVSQIVANERKKFDETKCFGANVNPDIYSLFESRWINMCNAENNEIAYKEEENNFYTFVSELKKVVEIVNNIKVSRVPYLRR